MMIVDIVAYCSFQLRWWICGSSWSSDRLGPL